MVLVHYIQEMPKGVKLTIYCRGFDDDDEGFAVNVQSDELGITALTARKWIIHTELEMIAGCKI